MQRLPLVAACCCFQASGHDINRLLAFLAGTRQLCAVAAPVLGQLVSGTLLWYARFRGLVARFPRPGVRLDAAPVNFGLLKPAGTKRCRKCRISTCCFDGAESSDVSPFMVLQMLFQLLLPTVSTA